jgi:hypothetical protein
MDFEIAIRLTEMLLALAFVQQSAEHVQTSPEERRLFLPRIGLSVLLLANLWTSWACLALLIHALFVLARFQGPYNGGSDRMGMLILCCLCLTHFMPTLQFQEYAFGYLALQVVLSYFIAGWVKIVNADWRGGQALQDVFRFSAYPVSEALRSWAEKPRLLFFASWAVMVFELVFPLSLLSQTTLIIAMIVAAAFHFWVWLAAYPSLLWLQDRIF